MATGMVGVSVCTVRELHQVLSMLMSDDPVTADQTVLAVTLPVLHSNLSLESTTIVHDYGKGLLDMLGLPQPSDGDESEHWRPY